MDFLNSILSMPSSTALPELQPAEVAAPPEADCLLRVRWAQRDGADVVSMVEFASAPLGTPTTHDASSHWRAHFLQVLISVQDLQNNPVFGFMIADADLLGRTEEVIRKRGRDRHGMNYELLLRAKRLTPTTWFIIDYEGVPNA